MKYDPQNSKRQEKVTHKKIILNGFTIVELLVSLSIMAIVFGLVTVNYRDFQRAKQLETARLEIVTAIRRAQQVANSGVQPSDCAELTGTRFTILSDPSNSYRYYATCFDGVSSSAKFYPDQTSFTSLPDGVRVQNSVTLGFNAPPKGGTFFSSAVTITISNESGSKVITAYPGGRIE